MTSSTCTTGCQGALASVSNRHRLMQGGGLGKSGLFHNFGICRKQLEASHFGANRSRDVALQRFGASARADGVRGDYRASRLAMGNRGIPTAKSKTGRRYPDYSAIDPQSSPSGPRILPWRGVVRAREWRHAPYRGRPGVPRNGSPHPRRDRHREPNSALWHIEGVSLVLVD
jgi:hypothetical protein